MRVNSMQSAAYAAVQGSGAVDEATQVAFMSRLAEAGGRRVQGARGLHYASAFATGAFTEKELLDNAKRGKRVDIDARLAQLSDEERAELAIRAHNIDQTRPKSDTAARLALIERDRQRRDNPNASAFVDSMEGIPGIGGLIRESSMDRLRRSFQRPQDREQKNEYNIFEYSRPIPVDTSAGRPIRGARGEGAY
jgi:hypothetical protein